MLQHPNLNFFSDKAVNLVHKRKTRIVIKQANIPADRREDGLTPEPVPLSSTLRQKYQN